jgi:murein DD-endopeptidase MepM/ murein hydrolase activator NlpD
MAGEIYAHPVGAPGARVSSGFGPRTHPVTGEYQSLHSGLDFPAPEGTPVYSLSSGTVSTVASDPISGNNVKIDHGQMFATGYLHLSEILVKPGQDVAAGTMIGRVGKTGRVTGPHLHFVVYRLGKPVDPMPYITIAVLPELARRAAAAAGAAFDTARGAAANYWWLLPIGASVLLLVAFGKRQRASGE